MAKRAFSPHFLETFRVSPVLLCDIDITLCIILIHLLAEMASYLSFYCMIHSSRHLVLPGMKLRSLDQYGKLLYM